MDQHYHLDANPESAQISLKGENIRLKISVLMTKVNEIIPFCLKNLTKS